MLYEAPQYDNQWKTVSGSGRQIIDSLILYILLQPSISICL